MHESFLSVGRVAVAVGLLFFVTTEQVVAQITSGSAVLTVNLSDLIQLTVNTNAVSLNFTSANSYKNGVTSLINNQITVSSNKAFDIRVRTSGPNLVSGANTIPVSNVSVQTVGLVGGTARVVPALSTTDQSSVTGFPSTSSTAINLQYSTAAGNTAFLKPAGAYVTTITFTLVAN